MTFSIYYPPQAEAGKKVPVVYYLSGLTCTDENFVQKAGAQRGAAALGLALIAPDTSPRGLNVPGEAESWDFGVGAGFYLNADPAGPWRNWRMYEYVTEVCAPARRDLRAPTCMPLCDIRLEIPQHFCALSTGPSTGGEADVEVSASRRGSESEGQDKGVTQRSNPFSGAARAAFQG